MAVKVVLNRANVRNQLLKSAEMMAICRAYAEQIAGRCGEGYGISPYVGTNRVNVSVTTTTYKAYKDNLDNNTILKNLR